MSDAAQDPSNGAPAPQHLPRGAGAILVALVGIAMCAWTWSKWCDPIIDFGRELYVPWRLSEGDVLYRDIVSYFNGPLSPYAHALLFGVFGVSLRTLVVFNLLLVAVLAMLLYRLVARVSDDLTAAAAGVAFFVLFAFAQFLNTANFNYVCPYSYELPHGITLTAAGLAFLFMWIRRDRAVWLALCGATLGLVALTKAEVFLAAAAALAVGLVAAVMTLKRARARSALIFLGAAVVPPLIAFALLCLALPPGEAARGLLGAWRWVGRRELTDLPYFRQLAGTDNIGASVMAMLKWTAVYVLLAAAGVGAGVPVRRDRRATVIASLVLAAAVLYVGRWYMFRVNWLDAVRPAPLVLLVACVVLAARLIRKRDARLVPPLALLVWAGTMLAKMPLNAHVHHYGFALAMPATLMLVVILVGWLPRLLERRGASGWPMRAGALAGLVVVMWAFSLPMRHFYATKQTHVARGTGDHFLADRRGDAVNTLLLVLERRTTPQQTLVMLPEGLIVNYLARRTNPTGQLNFTPPAIIMYGEDAMLDAFRRNPPDWIGVTIVDTSEYGARLFGQDYARRLGAWIEANYEDARLMPSSMHIRLLKRRGPAPTGTAPAVHSR